jgi:predicted dehydrogenase
MNRDIVRWGIVGCGAVTEVKSGPALQRASGSALVSVMRRTPGLAEDYARRHGVPRSTRSARALIDDPEVDAVYVATPPGSHLELCLAVAAAGKPAYVEKPMARSHAECARMIAAFADRGLPLFVAYYRRALPRFTLLRSLLDTGRIGRPTSLVDALHAVARAVQIEGRGVPLVADILLAEPEDGGCALLGRERHHRPRILNRQRS